MAPVLRRGSGGFLFDPGTGGVLQYPLFGVRAPSTVTQKTKDQHDKILVDGTFRLTAPNFRAKIEAIQSVTGRHKRRNKI